ncbi:hypothetical protein M9H77_29552 [Catharanthus roseus]|uniref:Uncharacterized protein n=1 Tax=Catharanthus roseus TaxID=4058 RepID=A0ACB9ZVT9_CATRO|nr:hypothetical protein M9H77_29552 [Catharanthus roseus]
MPTQNSHPFPESGYQGREPTRSGRRRDLRGRRCDRPQEEVPRHEAWHEDNLFEDSRENLNNALHINPLVKRCKSTCITNSRPKGRLHLCQPEAYQRQKGEPIVGGKLLMPEECPTESYRVHDDWLIERFFNDNLERRPIGDPFMGSRRKKLWKR